MLRELEIVEYSVEHLIHILFSPNSRITGKCEGRLQGPEVIVDCKIHSFEEAAECY